MIYCFISIDNSFYNSIYSGFEQEPNSLVKMPSHPSWNRIVNAVLGWKLPFPWLRAKILYNLFIKLTPLSFPSIKVENQLDTRFIIYGRVLQFYGPCIVEYLKKTYPDSFIICYLGDVVSSFTFGINAIKKRTDFVFSCDRKDSVNNGLLFLQEPYSHIDEGDSDIKYDFLFIGSEKGRLDRILCIYEELSDKGYNCLFYINGVDECKQKYKDKINYNIFLDYENVIRLIKESRCIIEVLQANADTTTTRYSEALLYKKYLLTDSQYLCSLKELPQNVICIDYKDWDNLDRIKQKLDYDNNEYKKDLSINTMVERIEKQLLLQK